MDGLAQSVITITHDFELIAHYDRAILIHDGAVAADGPPREIISRYVAMIDERDHTGARPSA
jgi:biotin transport system ATP-binding protein